MTLRKLSTIGLATLWSFAFIATHIPAGSLPNLHTGDKTLHLGGFFALVAAWLVTLRIRKTPFRRRLLLTLMVFPLYTLFDEGTQPLVNRWFSWLDILADLGGMTVALAIDGMVCWLSFLCRRDKT